MTANPACMRNAGWSVKVARRCRITSFWDVLATLLELRSSKGQPTKGGDQRFAGARPTSGCHFAPPTSITAPSTSAIDIYFAQASQLQFFRTALFCHHIAPVASKRASRFLVGTFVARPQAHSPRWSLERVPARMSAR